jgi:aarF domain-containing kinase
MTPENLSFDFSIFSGPDRQPFGEHPVDKSMSDDNKVAPRVQPKRPPIIRTETSAKFYFDYEGYLKENDDKYSEAIEQKVPTTSAGRAWEWTRTGVSVLGGAAFNTAMSSVGIRSKAKQNGDGSEFLAQIATEENAERLSMALCKMRGAALKVGQALSMQEDHLIPENLRKAFDKAKQSANIMPKSQLNAALVKELGPDWMSNFETFDQRPIAAASIGQVHRATLKNGREVILKIQYPGVSTSIDSDLDNLRRLMVWTGQFPRGKQYFYFPLIAKRSLLG